MKHSSVIRAVKHLAIVTALAMCAVLVSPVAELSATHSLRLVFFGDSLSDSGNHFLAFHEVSTRPFEMVPDAPYAVGGLHFTNGPTWAEQLSYTLHTPTSGLPSLLASRVFTNYAVGRARARAAAPTFPYFDLATQIARYRSDFAAGAPENAVYVVWIGSNDVSDALTASATDPTGATSMAILQSALGAVGAGMHGLWQAGARDFLVVNLPNFASTPAVRAAGPQAQAAATIFSNAYNAGLAQVVGSVSGLPGIHIRGLDAYALLSNIVENPETFGLANAEASCLTFGVVQNPFCRRPNDYLFWDGIHPTKAGHSVVAAAAAQVLATQ